MTQTIQPLRQILNQEMTANDCKDIKVQGGITYSIKTSVVEVMRYGAHIISSFLFCIYTRVLVICVHFNFTVSLSKKRENILIITVAKRVK